MTSTTTRKAAPQKRSSSASSIPPNGRRRVCIESVEPCVDGGRFPIKRVPGETVAVGADVFTDGHDRIACVLEHRRQTGHSEDAGADGWHEHPMTALVNDRWQGEFTAEHVGRSEYRIVAWIDHFSTRRDGLAKKHGAGQDVESEMTIGAELIEGAAADADADARDDLVARAETLRSDRAVEQRVAAALDEGLRELMHRHAPREHAASSDAFAVVVDPPRARFSTWYELFPRSTALEPGRHGTFSDVEARLPYIAGMGFDVLYLPPIHPIGQTHRKGPNNALRAGPDDVGSPWAIGGAEGGHMSVHPDLGTPADFRRLVEAARGHGIDVALDIAFQCSPDHPYVREHPEWFKHRPDGSIQYAENPPKKYQDIYPFDFECEQWDALWRELLQVFRFWIEQGVTIFRVDNPHTKALPFWEWAIGEIKRDHPEAIFLSEAFTRPKVMYRLAKLGFTQSYTYFAWRNEPWELEQYFRELTGPPVCEFFRPNLWPNTPDILTEHLQHGGRRAAQIRVLLAGTLGASYGIYGPTFELAESQPREPGSEEYLDSEKYQLRSWDLERRDSLQPVIARLNRIRRDNPSLQQDRTLAFHRVDNPKLIAYSKTADDNVILAVVNTNPYATESGTVSLDLDALGIDGQSAYRLQDLLTGTHYQWSGPHQHVSLDPGIVPAHILRVLTSGRSERDFEYFL